MIKCFINFVKLISYYCYNLPFLLMKYIYINIYGCIFVCIWYYIYIWLIAIKMYSSTNCFYLLPIFLLRYYFSYWFKKLCIQLLTLYTHWIKSWGRSRRESPLTKYPLCVRFFHINYLIYPQNNPRKQVL